MNAQEIARSSPGGLAVYASPYRYSLAPHLKLLNKALIRAATMPEQRIIVSMPPRHGKSELTSVYFPAWYLSKFRHRQLILASYESTFAAEFGGKARDVAREFGPEVFGVEVDKGQDSRDHWRVGPSGDSGLLSAAEKKGAATASSVMRTAGLGGPVTGKGADVLLVDDPVKNHEEALSAASRESKWEWFISTAYPRLQKGGSAMDVQTRWHEDDVAGRLIQLSEDGIEDWEVINLPAIAEENDPLGREEGEALWPEMFPIERLLKIKEVLGPYWFSALYQGRPTPLEGGIFKWDWMQERYDKLPNLHRKIQTVDAAFKTGLDNDYSVIATWGTDGVDYYVVDVWREKVEFHALKQAIQDQFYKHEPSATYVEDAAAGQSVIQELQRETALPVIGKPVWGNDMQRALAVSGIFEAKKVKLPRRGAWVADWIQEHTQFPNGAHDDQITTTYYALEELAYVGTPIMEFV